jgi:nucleotide-binding universal stress UspA family protein
VGDGVACAAQRVVQTGTGEQDATAGELAERQADQVAVAADLPHAEVIGQVGDPTDAIIDAAARCHADVIVVGSHDRNWFQRLLSPSVADAVVHDARVPVLVVHAR